MAEQSTTETVEQEQTNAATAEATEEQGQEQEQSSEAPDESRDALKAALKRANKEAEKNRRLKNENENQKKMVEEDYARLKEETDGLRSQLLAFEMVVTYDLPADLIHLLTGTDREKIEKDAKALKAHMKPAAATDFDSGARDVVEKPLSAEEAHQSTLVTLLRAKGKLPPT